VPAARAGAGLAAGELVPGATRRDVGELPGFLPPEPRIAVNKLPSGLTVVTVHRPGPAAVAWLGFRGGYTDADPPLLVELALRTRPEARQATRLHIVPGRGATRDMSFEAVEFLPAGLADALALLFAKAAAPVKEWPGKDGLERLLAAAASLEDAQTQKASHGFLRALFGDHPFARIVTTADLAKLTRSDIDTWVGRVHNVRNAALVVVGDVDRGEVERTAAILSRQLASPSWIANLPSPPPPAVRPARGERMQPVITARPGTLTDIRIGCLLPPLTGADRGHYELLRNAIEVRLNAALRINEGDGYGVEVAFERLRGGTTYLLASTFVEEAILPRTLASVRAHWRRWASEGFDASEINVARWRQAAKLAIQRTSPHAIAFELLDDWSADPATLDATRARTDLGALRAARVNEIFATCKANAVLGLTGNETAIRQALDRTWSGLASAVRHEP
jgi:predicted Zn-dependent peptidase